MSRRIGLIGCGLWGRNILRDLLRLDCDVQVADPDPENARLARAAGASRVFETGEPKEALNGVDGVVVATPATTHRRVIEACALAGVPIFTEKPFTTTVEDAEALAAAFADRLFVMHVWRYHPGIEALGRIAREGTLGAVSGVRTTRTNWTSPRTDVDGIWTLVPHDVSIALEILGAVPEPEAALAEMHEDVPVGLVGLLRLASDARVHARPWLAVDVSTRYRDKRREVRLHCTDGVAVLAGGDADRIEITRGDAFSHPDAVVADSVSFTDESALLRELRAFVEHLGGGPPPRSSATEALAVVRAVTGLRRLAGIPS